MAAFQYADKKPWPKHWPQDSAARGAGCEVVEDDDGAKTLH